MSKPICNSMSNGLQYYTDNPLEGVSNVAGGFSSLVSTLSSCIVLTILGIVSYSSRGFDILTNVLLLFIVMSVGSMIYNVVMMNKKPSGYTEDCEYNANL